MDEQLEQAVSIALEGGADPALKQQVSYYTPLFTSFWYAGIGLDLLQGIIFIRQALESFPSTLRVFKACSTVNQDGNPNPCRLACFSHLPPLGLVTTPWMQRSILNYWFDGIKWF